MSKGALAFLQQSAVNVNMMVVLTKVIDRNDER